MAGVVCRFWRSALGGSLFVYVMCAVCAAQSVSVTVSTDRKIYAIGERVAISYSVSETADIILVDHIQGQPEKRFPMGRVQAGSYVMMATVEPPVGVEWIEIEATTPDGRTGNAFTSIEIVAGTSGGSSPPPVPGGSESDVHWEGTAVELVHGPYVLWWIVHIDRVMSGSSPCTSDILVFVGGGVIGHGTVDQGIQPGDRVEILGNYWESQGECTVDLPEARHYIRRAGAGGSSHSLRVQVYDAVSGAMIPGAQVRLLASPFSQGITDGRGEARLQVPGGRITVQASKDGYSSGTWQGITNGDFGIAIALQPDEAKHRVVVQVYDLSTRAMLPDVTVSSSGAASATTDARGEATLMLPPGSVVVTASLSGYANGSWSGQISGPITIAIGLTPEEARVDLAITEDDIFLTLADAGFGEEGVFEVTARVRNEGTQAARGVEVLFAFGAGCCPPISCPPTFEEATFYIPHIAAGGSEEVTAEYPTWNSTFTWETVEAIVDPENEVPESDEGNNSSIAIIRECSSDEESPSEVALVGTITEPDNGFLDSQQDLLVRVDELLASPSTLRLTEGSNVMVLHMLNCDPSGDIYPVEWVPASGERVEVLGLLSHESVQVPGHTQASWTITLCGSASYYARRLPTVADSDDDGLPDWKEEIAGTDPDNPDCDGDGLKDGQELNGWDVSELLVEDASIGSVHDMSEMLGGLGLDGRTWGGGWDAFPEDLDGDGDADTLPFFYWYDGYLERDANGDGRYTVEDEAMIHYVNPARVKTDPHAEDTDGDGILDPSDPFPTGLVTKCEICVKGIWNLYTLRHRTWKDRSLESCVSNWYSYGYTVDETGLRKSFPVTNPRNTSAGYDYDGDGISLSGEAALDTQPGLIRDSHGPGFTDEIPKEKAFDSDGDGIGDLQEILQKSNPRDDKGLGKPLVFVELSPPIEIGPYVSVSADLRDFMRISEDGKAGWVTLWIGAGWQGGLSLVPVVDAGLSWLETEDPEEDPRLPDSKDFKLLWFGLNGSFHLNPGVSVGEGGEICRFDIKIESLEALANVTLMAGSIHGVAKLLVSPGFTNWLGRNLPRILDLSYPEGVRNASISGFSKGIEFYAYCPVDIAVTDPDGLTYGIGGGTIPDAAYDERDLDGDGEADDQIWIRNRKPGEYRLEVRSEESAQSTETYSLVVASDEGVLHLADRRAVPTRGTDSFRVNVSDSTGVEAVEGSGSWMLTLMIGVPALAMITIGVFFWIRKRHLA